MKDILRCASSHAEFIEVWCWRKLPFDKFRVTSLFFFLFLISFLTSCKKEPVPAYLYIPEITLTTETEEGSSSEKITDVWVFQNGNQQGAYELPLTFPIIAEGQTSLIFFAGIKLNGISATRAMYSFYEPDTIVLDLESTETDTVIPAVKYRKNIEFYFIEDFEAPADAVFNSLVFVSDAADVFEGSASGRLRIDSASTEATANTKGAYQIKPLTAAAFLEMDYKSNHEFTVTLKGYKGSESITQDKLNVSPKEDWNKIYVNFTPEINRMQADSYEIILKANANGISADSIKIFVDNLKLISFP